MAFHSQTIGNRERGNRFLNRYFRNLVGVYQLDWMHYVGQTMFNYNATMHLATKGSSFVVALSVNALQPTNLALKDAHSILELNQDGEDLATMREQDD